MMRIYSGLLMRAGSNKPGSSCRGQTSNAILDAILEKDALARLAFPIPVNTTGLTEKQTIQRILATVIHTMFFLFAHSRDVNF